MKNVILILALLLTVPEVANDKNWQKAVVVGVGDAIPARGTYWIRGDDTTYVIHNYANGAVVQWWIYLTLGGNAKIYSDGKNLHLVDNQGKERKAQILQSMSNPIADGILAKQARKTPEQLLAEKQQHDAALLQEQALRQRATESLKPTKIEVQVKDCTKFPALCQ